VTDREIDPHVTFLLYPKWLRKYTATSWLKSEVEDRFSGTVREEAIIPRTVGVYACLITRKTASDVVKGQLSLYFGKKVTLIEGIKGNKKSDHWVVFEDGSRTPTQLKHKSTETWDTVDRGHSTGRKPVTDLTDDIAFQTLYDLVCLKRTELSTVPNIDRCVFESIIKQSIIGLEPTAFIFSETNNGAIHIRGIISTASLLSFLNKSIYTQKEFSSLFLGKKKTTIPISKYLTLQRKGGTNTDKKDYINNYTISEVKY
jgi:hypothetical protein